jgi:uncharacterized protein
MKSASPIAALLRSLLTASIALCPAGLALATDLEVGTEFLYPTEFEVRPATVSGNGQIIQEAVVVPMNFQARVVGIRLSVEAIVSSANTALRSLEQEKMNGNTPLMVAATAGDDQAVRRLVFKGAGVNAKNNFGSTALMGASAGGFEDIVKLLLVKDAKPNLKSNSGCTALMFAARNGHLPVVRLLLDAGANPNESDQQGLKPLMYAVVGANAEVVSLLIEKGAEVNSTDLNGATPLRLAARQNDADLVVLLARAGAKR